ncbi:hypothetical protein RAS1_25600 [Phycisphaerae bacterium RAS1]|nr:hypothetical protein RAS1_25600 [Phycisphaerae bacterium RAS1]
MTPRVLRMAAFGLLLTSASGCGILQRRALADDGAIPSCLFIVNSDTPPPADVRDVAEKLGFRRVLLVMAHLLPEKLGGVEKARQYVAEIRGRGDAALLVGAHVYMCPPGATKDSAKSVFEAHWSRLADTYNAVGFDWVYMDGMEEPTVDNIRPGALALLSKLRPKPRWRQGSAYMNVNDLIDETGQVDWMQPQRVAQFRGDTKALLNSDLERCRAELKQAVASRHAPQMGWLPLSKLGKSRGEDEEPFSPSLEQWKRLLSVAREYRAALCIRGTVQRMKAELLKDDVLPLLREYEAWRMSGAP